MAKKKYEIFSFLQRNVSNIFVNSSRKVNISLTVISIVIYKQKRSSDVRIFGIILSTTKVCFNTLHLHCLYGPEDLDRPPGFSYELRYRKKSYIFFRIGQNTVSILKKDYLIMQLVFAIIKYCPKATIIANCLSVEQALYSLCAIFNIIASPVCPGL